MAVKELDKLLRQVARYAGAEEEVTVRHDFQRLGIILMKGNAALITSRILYFAPKHVDGVVEDLEET